jgi:DNA-binding NtrC family response regulator
MPAKVLIVDDEKDFLDIMAERLGARGMEVSTATSAENALKMVLKESFDAVIMDLMMPEMDGFKALKLFKETRPDLPIILLTANVPEEKCIEAIKLGAMDVIEKPADLNLLTQKVEEAKALKVNLSKTKHDAAEGALEEDKDN